MFFEVFKVFSLGLVVLYTVFIIFPSQNPGHNPGQKSAQKSDKLTEN